MKRAIVVAAALLLVLVALLLVRALGLESRQLAVAPVPRVALDADASASRLAEALRYRTISHFDSSRLDARAFLAFQAFLERTFPGAHGALGRERTAGYSLLYTWPGSDASLPPLLLVAHQDVVPVPEETVSSWTHPPFEGVIADGFVWGRGSMDDKGNVLAILEAVEHHLRSGFAPRRTLHLAFGHDEEVGGEGAQAVAALLGERGVRPEFVLDEGMALVEGVVPGIEGPVALVGVAEKGYLSLRLRVEQPGGHSSTPPSRTAVGVVATAVHRLERAPLPARLDGVTRTFFAYIAPELPLGFRVAFANLWLSDPPLKHLLGRSPATNAMLRTTTAATMMQGSPKDNVLPSRAEAVVNFRILPGDSVASVIEHVRRAVDDSRVRIEPIGTPREPSPISDPASPDFALLQRTIGEVFPQAIVAPALVLGGTDGRYYGVIAEDVYRFSPYRFGAGDLSRAHGIDERISVEGHADAIRFYIRLIRNAAG